LIVSSNQNSTASFGSNIKEIISVSEPVSFNK
jgi:hypothetical protein